MHEVRLFENSEFGKLEILMLDGKEYFPATQCAKALGYSNPKKAVLDHCKEDGVTKRDRIDNMGRTQVVKYISEGNLYRLIIRSKLPAAERFERWVFDEVLPVLRKTGQYSAAGRERETAELKKWQGWLSHYEDELELAEAGARLAREDYERWLVRRRENRRAVDAIRWKLGRLIDEMTPPRLEE